MSNDSDNNVKGFVEDMTALKPCAHCGNKYPFLWSPNGGYAWVASCEHSGCMIRTLACESKQDAIKRWNRRVA